MVTYAHYTPLLPELSVWILFVFYFIFRKWWENLDSSFGSYSLVDNEKNVNPNG